jgi:DegV family protein with EDD domain
MAGVAVVTDTTHYLPRALVERLDLHEVSLHVNWAGRRDRESELLEDFEPFYRHLRDTRDGELPTTSQPSVGEFLEVYEPMLDSGYDVVSVHLAGGLSGTVASAEQAKAQLEDRGLEPGRLTVIDSDTACGALGLVVLAAAAAARAGADADGVADRVREARRELKMWFCIDTLEYLRRGGRIGGAQAWLGSALKIKPILTVEAQITPVERVRTSGRAFERMVEYLESRREAGADGWVVQHIQAPEDAERLAERGRELFGTEPVFVSEVGPVIGAHVGPGLTGVGGVPRRLVE